MRCAGACAHTRRTGDSACFSWSAGVEGGDRGRWDDLAMTENVGLGGGQQGGVDGGAGAAGQAHRVHPAQVGGDAAPGGAGAAFGDADEQQRQPAQQDVGADAMFESVEDRPEQ